MRRFSTLLAVATLCCSAVWSVLPAQAASRIERGGVVTPHLPNQMAYQIYLPSGYDRGGTSLRVVYLLHGAGGNARTWSRLGKIKSTADHLIATGKIPPIAIVMPGCSKCWWLDGVKNRAETAIWQDLIPAIERRYRVQRDREGRYFAGLSAGGYAALRYALKYPDKIAGVAALSPAIYRRSPPSFSAARRNPLFLSHNGQFSYAAWYRRNYPAYLNAYKSQPHRVRMHLVSGRQDRFQTASESVHFYLALRRYQRDAISIRFLDGRHTWTFWSQAIGGALIALLDGGHVTSAPTAWVSSIP